MARRGALSVIRICCKHCLGEGDVNAREEMGLVLELDPTCFLFHMNSVDIADDSRQNVRWKYIFSTASPTKETAPHLVTDAENGVSFAITRTVRKGEELLHFFPTENRLASMKGGGGTARVSISPSENDTPTSGSGVGVLFSSSK